ncbi:hypothetical protein ALC53_05056, partial [Atta colombica]
VGVKLQSRLNSYTAAIECIVTDRITGKIPTFSLGRDKFNLPCKICLADPRFHGDLRESALKRLRGIDRRFKRDPILKIQYAAFLDEYLSLEHMQRMEPPIVEETISFYLPHHCVFKTVGQASKIRIVFDASCRSSSGVSLNNALLVGSTVQQDLISILMRFRAEQHAHQFTRGLACVFRDFYVDDMFTLRLELSTALLLARLINKVRESLELSQCDLSIDNDLSKQKKIRVAVFTFHSCIIDDLLNKHSNLNKICRIIAYIKRGIRSGLSQCSVRYIQANNKYIRSYGSPEFRWVEDAANFDASAIALDSPSGYILDLNYPQHLYDRHITFLSLPYLSTRDKPPGKHRVQLLQFAQSPWLRDYIEFNINFITSVMNNAVFGKTMENVINKVGRYEAMIAKPNFHSRTIFAKNLIVVELSKLEVKFKPIYIGMYILDEENNGAIMTEFVGLKAKMYAVRLDGKKDIKKAKDIKV